MMPPSQPAAAAAAVDNIDVHWEDAAAESYNMLSDITELLSKRLLLDIVMKLPVVVIPLSSQSTGAIVVDLGGFSVVNELRVVPNVFSVDNIPAVIDWTNFHIAGGSIAR